MVSHDVEEEGRSLNLEDEDIPDEILKRKPQTPALQFRKESCAQNCLHSAQQDALRQFDVSRVLGGFGCARTANN